MKSTGIGKILNPVRGDVWYVSKIDNVNFGAPRYMIPREEDYFETSTDPGLSVSNGRRGSAGNMRRMLELYSPSIPLEESMLLKIFQIASLLSSRGCTSKIYSTLIDLDI